MRGATNQTAAPTIVNAGATTPTILQLADR
jgi:hypothetical protein